MPHCQFIKRLSSPYKILLSSHLRYKLISQIYNIFVEIRILNLIFQSIELNAQLLIEYFVQKKNINRIYFKFFFLRHKLT